MCGIFGFYGSDEFGEAELQKMASTIQYRGPDGVGLSVYRKCGIGNVRLAIIDPADGHQPFYSSDKSVALVQNGEIFNFKSLKAELENRGHKFSTHCDTEVLLAMYMEYGESFVNRLNGMFAIAVRDTRKQCLYLFRDRIGEKPLYYYSAPDKFLFASEIKAIGEVVPIVPCLSSINAMLRLNYVPSPLTAYRDVYHVKPGHYLRVDETGVTENTWWDLAGQSDRTFESESAWQDECITLLDDAVRLRLVSDVPFGAFLSGGVDSSTVVGLMAKHMSEPVKTYTIGFPNPDFDESPYAAAAAKRFGTRHTCEMVTYDVVSDWENFIYYCDQPHGDVSFIPMRKVSEIASRDVKMVLTGDGADELFAGYEKYVNYFGSAVGDNNVEFLNDYVPNIELFSRAECSELWKENVQADIDEFFVDRALSDAVDKVKHFDDVNKALYLDMIFLLPGNNLVKPDRMAMSHSLETRAPFLDYRMMEFAFQTPGSYKLNASDKKHLFKKAVTPLIGRDLAYRKKQMFTMPIGEWFRRELKQFCVDMLLSKNSKLLDYFKQNEVERLVRDHVDGRQNYTRQVRALISIELWLRKIS